MKLLFENWRKYLNEAGNSDLVKQAFENTDSGHLAGSIKQRTPGPESAGSVFSQPTSIEDLANAPWAPYKHAAIKAPAIGLKAPIPGILGIAEITDPSIPDEIMFQPAHAGKAMTKEPNPETGEHEVLAEVVAPISEAGRMVEHTTLLLGPSREDPDKIQVWTFFPGDPTPQLPEITMRQVQKKYGTSKTQIRGAKQDAIDMGYGFVKHVDRL